MKISVCLWICIYKTTHNFYSRNINFLFMLPSRAAAFKLGQACPLEVCRDSHGQWQPECFEGSQHSEPPLTYVQNGSAWGYICMRCRCRSFSQVLWDRNPASLPSDYVVFTWGLKTCGEANSGVIWNIGKKVTKKESTCIQGIWSILSGGLYGKRIWEKKNVCITDSLCCTPEANTTLYVHFAPIKFFQKRK